MDVKSESIGISSDATLKDLFELYAGRSMPDVSEKQFLTAKNAFYMGVNATLTLTYSANSGKELLEKLMELEKEFEVYHADLVGRS